MKAPVSLGRGIGFYLFYGTLGVVLLAAASWGGCGTSTVLFPPVDGSPLYHVDAQRRTLEGLSGSWNEELLGQCAGAISFYPARLLAVILPPMMSHTLGYFIDAALLAVALLFFLRGRGCRGWPAYLAGLAMGFSGYTFTLISAGHREFCDMMPFAVFTLAFIDRAVTRQSIFYVAWAGLAAAFGVVSQPDVMGLFGLLTIVYGGFLLVRQWRSHPGTRKRLILTVLLGGLVASMCFGAVALSGKAFLTRVVGVRESVRGQSSDEKWIFATNWSLPPEDMLEFLLPCIFGVQSGDPNGPYWGRLGQAFGWERSRQGLLNYRQHTVYLGGIQLVFAIYALVWAIRTRGQRKMRVEELPDAEGHESILGAVSSAAAAKDFCAMAAERRAHTAFWWMVAIVGTALALGRYFFLYRLFYMLPYLSMIRCPVKFIHLVEVALAILFAFGLHAFVTDIRVAVFSLHGKGKKKVDPRAISVERSARRALLGFCLGCGALALLLWIVAGVVGASRNAFFSHWRSLSPSFEPYFDVMLANLTGAFVHAGLLMFAAAAAFLLGRFFGGKRSVNTLVVAGLALVLCVDLVSVGSRYIPIGDIRPWYASNPVTDRVQAEPLSRVWSLFDRDPRIFNGRNWFFGSFAVRAIPLMLLGENIGQPQDWPADYKAFFGTLQKAPLRLWTLTNTRFLIGPRAALTPFERHPSFEKVMTFDATDGRVIQADGDRGQMGLLRFKDALPRAAMFYAWESMSQEQALAMLPKAEWNPLKTLLVSDRVPPAYSDLVSSPAQIVTHRSNRMVVQVSALQDGILLLNDKFDPDWVVRVDGQRKPLLRCNYIMRGVQVPAGRHTVVFTYYPYLAPFLLSVGTCLALLLWTGVRWIRRRRAHGAGGVPI